METTITVDSEMIKVPLKVLDEAGRAGLTMLTLAPGAYLILRSDLASQYQPDRLAEVLRAAVSLQQPPGKGAAISAPVTGPPKQRALQELHEKGYPVSDGSEYGLQSWLRPDVTLERVREELSSMRRSLTDVVISQRGEE